jgi:hypothetical protein
VSGSGRRGQPRPDGRTAAAAQPAGTPGEATGGSGPIPATGTANEATGASGPVPATGTGTGTAIEAPGTPSPVTATGTASEAEGYDAGSRAELPDRSIALTALALAMAVLLAEGYLVAGPAGFVVAGTVLALVAILFARATMPRGEQRPPRTVRKDHGSGDSSEADFPVYRKITSDLSWANSSPRHYDHGLRPRLAGLLDARLAQRYGLDAAARPDRARELVGAELWPLLDMSRPPSNDSRAPGVSMATVDRIVTRLEEL